MRLRTALQLGRVSNLPTVWTNVLAGLALAGWGTTSARTVAVLCAAMSLLYVGGMFLNDACDAAVDAIERPERPIPSGHAGRGEVLAWAIALLAGGVAMALRCGLYAGLGALLTAGAIALYDVTHKQTRAAPALMALCRVGVYWTAALVVANVNAPRVAVGSTVLFTYVLGLTYAAARENSTALVRFGPLIGLWAPLLLAAPALAGSTRGLVLLALFVAWMVHTTALVRSRQPFQVRRGIGGLIAGIGLLDALWLAIHGPSPLLAPGAVAAFALTLLLQHFVAGT